MARERHMDEKLNVLRKNFLQQLNKKEKKKLKKKMKKQMKNLQMSEQNQYS